MRVKAAATGAAGRRAGPAERAGTARAAQPTGIATAAFVKEIVISAGGLMGATVSRASHMPAAAESAALDEGGGAHGCAFCPFLTLLQQTWACTSAMTQHVGNGCWNRRTRSVSTSAPLAATLPPHATCFASCHAEASIISLHAMVASVTFTVPSSVQHQIRSNRAISRRGLVRRGCWLVSREVVVLVDGLQQEAT